MYGGDVREETVVRSAFGGTPGSHGSKAADTAEPRVGGGAITVAPPATRQHWQLNSGEAGPSNA